MVTTMITFIHISTAVAMISTAIVCLNYLLKTANYAINYAIVDKHIKICRTASLTFTLLAWLTNSFEQKSVCLKGYLELSSICSRIGYLWLIYAFVCVVVCIVMLSMKKENSLIDGISKFRNKGFLMGAIFLTIAFLLDTSFLAGE